MWIKFYENTPNDLKINLLAAHTEKTVNECLGVYVRLALFCGYNPDFDFSTYDDKAMMLVCGTENPHIIEDLISSGILVRKKESLVFCDGQKCQGSTPLAKNQLRHREKMKNKRPLILESDLTAIEQTF